MKNRRSIKLLIAVLLVTAMVFGNMQGVLAAGADDGYTGAEGSSLQEDFSSLAETEGASADTDTAAWQEAVEGDVSDPGSDAVETGSAGETVEEAVEDTGADVTSGTVNNTEDDNLQQVSGDLIREDETDSLGTGGVSGNFSVKAVSGYSAVLTYTGSKEGIGDQDWFTLVYAGPEEIFEMGDRLPGTSNQISLGRISGETPWNFPEFCGADSNLFKPSTTYRCRVYLFHLSTGTTRACSDVMSFTTGSGDEKCTAERVEDSLSVKKAGYTAVRVTWKLYNPDNNAVTSSYVDYVAGKYSGRSNGHKVDRTADGYDIFEADVIPDGKTVTVEAVNVISFDGTRKDKPVNRMWFGTDEISVSPLKFPSSSVKYTAYRYEDDEGYGGIEVYVSVAPVDDEIDAGSLGAYLVPSNKKYFSWSGDNLTGADGCYSTILSDSDTEDDDGRQIKLTSFTLKIAADRGMYYESGDDSDEGEDYDEEEEPPVEEDHYVLWSSGSKTAPKGDFSPIADIKLDHASKELNEGESASIKAEVLIDEDGTPPKNLNVQWLCSDESIVQVAPGSNNTAQILALKEGTATVTACAMDGSGVETPCKITVKPVEKTLQQVVLSEKDLSLLQEEEADLSASIVPQIDPGKLQSVTWSSSSPECVSVTKDTGDMLKAHVKALKPSADGSPVSVTVTAKDKAGNEKKSACLVTVTSSLPAEDKKKAQEEAKKAEQDAGITPPAEDKPVWACLKDNIYKYPYTGAAVTPIVQVYDGARLLTEKSDYTVKYFNNTNVPQAGAAADKKPRAQITLAGSYQKEDINVYFSIEPLSFSAEGETFEAGSLFQTYKGKTLTPAPDFRRNGKKLTKGTASNGKDYYVAGYEKVTEYDPDAKACAIADKPSGLAASITAPGLYNVILGGTSNYSGYFKVPCVVSDPSSEVMLSDSKFKVQIFTKDSAGKDKSVTTVPYEDRDLSKGKSEDDKFTVAVTYQGKALDAAGYRLSQEDTENAGKTTLTVAGTGAEVSVDGKSYRFYGNKSLSFTVQGIKLSDAAKIDESASKWKSEIGYDAKEAADKDGITQPSPGLVPKNGATLPTGDSYYEISYSNNRKAGTATMTVTGRKEYTGTITKTFKIIPDASKPFDIAAVPDVTYEKGKTFKPEPVVKVGDVVLTKNTDYSLGWANTNAAGDPMSFKKPTVKVTGKGNYKGLYKEQYFTINKKELEDCGLIVQDMAYQKSWGKFKSAPVFTDANGKKLSAGTDYERLTDESYSFSGMDYYKANKRGPAIGTVITVTVTGKGNYEGTVKSSYRIVDGAYLVSKASMKVLDQSYTGKAVTLSANEFRSSDGKTAPTMGSGKTKKQLKLGTDYEIIGYADNVKAGKASVTVRGIGQYGGTRTLNFNIKQKQNKNLLSLIF